MALKRLLDRIRSGSRMLPDGKEKPRKHSKVEEKSRKLSDSEEKSRDANILEEAQRLIRELRNGRNVAENWPAFDRLVKGNLKEVAETFSTRWLISICDTYADYGDPLRSRHAMTISFFVNMIRLAETVKFTRPAVDPERLAKARRGMVPLYDELNTFSINSQDVFLNLARRFYRQVKDDEVMFPIWRTVLTRFHRGDNIISEFANASPVRERYFPIMPEGMKNNHGV